MVPAMREKEACGHAGPGERKKMKAQLLQRSYCIPPNRNVSHKEPRNKHKGTAGMFRSNLRVSNSFINIFWWWLCVPGDLNACLLCLSGNPAWHQGITPDPQRLVMKEKGGPSGTGNREDSGHCSWGSAMTQRDKSSGCTERPSHAT